MMNRTVLALLLAGLLLGCSKKKEEPPDHPRLPQTTVLNDVTFHSGSLGRDMRYRVVLPKNIAAGQRLPLVMLLHGGGGDFRDWTNYTDVALFAESGMILIMPEADDSYYTNSAEKLRDRYEDYIIKDIIEDVQIRFPVSERRAIVGISMGGFGAVKLALRHPQMFVFAAGISSALDVPSRRFSIKRPLQWRFHRSIFGPWNGQTQRDNDPFVLARSVDPKETPYLFLTCGDQEGLLPTNRQFAKLLEERHFQYEFHVGAGGHNWNQWNNRLPAVFRRLSEHLRT